MPAKYYTVPEAARAIKRGVTTIYEQVERLSLGLRTVGGTVILSTDDLAELRAHKGQRGRPRKVAQ